MTNKDALYLSKSSIETFLNCPAKFKFRYLERLEAVQKEGQSDAAIFGNVVHSALEDYFNPENKESIVDLFKKHFEIYKITNDELFYTGLSLLEDYVNTIRPGQKSDLEKDFLLFLDNGVPVKGIIDRIDYISDTEIEIIDYKTGRGLPLTPDAIKRDIQLGIYDLVVRMLNPSVKTVKLTLSYLRYGKVSAYKTELEAQNFKEYLSVIYKKILNAIDSEELEPHINTYCNYCDYKYSCEKYQETIKSNTDIKTIDSDFKGLIAPETGIMVSQDKVGVLRDRITNKIKILEKLKENVDQYIKDTIKAEGSDNKYKFGDKTYSLTNKKYTDYDVNEVLAICEEQGINPATLLSVAKTEVDKVAKKDPAIAERLSKTAKQRFSEAQIK